MGRLCERPGCSENAAVAYGMRTEDLVFWIDVLSDSTAVAGGVLCQRHGDSMVVPRGWTLDDLRDPELHLFRPPRPERRIRSAAPRRQRIVSDDTRQLELGGILPPEPGAEDAAVATPPAAPAAAGEPVAGRMDEAHDHAAGATGPVERETPDPDERWTPTFDDGDDLDGLLSARSPLLSRAFRGTDRPG